VLVAVVSNQSCFKRGDVEHPQTRRIPRCLRLMPNVSVNLRREAPSGSTPR
jgi:hypothetical protein